MDNPAPLIKDARARAGYFTPAHLNYVQEIYSRAGVADFIGIRMNKTSAAKAKAWNEWRSNELFNRQLLKFVRFYTVLMLVVVAIVLVLWATK